MMNAYDRNALFTRAMNTIEQHSHSVWTDYHLHDPGITILEQFAAEAEELNDTLTEFDLATIIERRIKQLALPVLHQQHGMAALIEQFDGVLRCWQEGEYLFVLLQQQKNKRGLQQNLRHFVKDTRRFGQKTYRIKWIEPQLFEHLPEDWQGKQSELLPALNRWNGQWLSGKCTLPSIWKLLYRFFPEMDGQHHPSLRLSSNQVWLLPQKTTLALVERPSLTSEGLAPKVNHITSRFPTAYALREGEMVDTAESHRKAAKGQLEQFLELAEAPLKSLQQEAQLWRSFINTQRALSFETDVEANDEYRRCVAYPGFGHWLLAQHKLLDFKLFLMGESPEKVDDYYDAATSLLIKRRILKLERLLHRNRARGQRLTNGKEPLALSTWVNLFLANCGGFRPLNGLHLVSDHRLGWRWQLTIGDAEFLSPWFRSYAELASTYRRLKHRSKLKLAVSQKLISITDKTTKLVTSAGPLTVAVAEQFKIWQKQPADWPIVVLEGGLLSHRLGPWPQLILVLPDNLKPKSELIKYLTHRQGPLAAETAYCWLPAQSYDDFRKIWTAFKNGNNSGTNSLKLSRFLAAVREGKL